MNAPPDAIEGEIDCSEHDEMHCAWTSGDSRCAAERYRDLQIAAGVGGARCLTPRLQKCGQDRKYQTPPPCLRFQF